MNQLYQRQYEAAFALNSMAITMMKGSCYQQAADTLRDALLALPGEPSLVISAQPHIAQLDRAKHRIFNPEPEQASVPVYLKVIHHNEGITIEDPSGIFVTPEIAAANGYYPVIRMESYDILPHEAYAILLFNAAVCLWCQGQGQEQANNTTQGMSNSSHARQLLQESLGVLNGLYNTSQCPFAIKRLISLLMINCGMYAHMFRSLGWIREAIVFETTILAALTAAATELELFTFMQIASPAA
jgi:hypothetical protein